MNYLILFIGLLLISTSCVQEPEVDKPEIVKQVVKEVVTNETVVEEEAIEEVIEKYKVGFKQLVFIDDSSCFVPELKWSTINEDSLLALDENVYRKGDTLFFKLINGDSLTLISIEYDERELVDPISETVVYNFNGSVNNLEYWNILAYCYECHYTVLIDKETGELINTLGNVSVSPSEKYVLLFNEDIDAGFTTNGLELFEVEKEKLNLIGKLEIYEWGPNQVKWINDSTLWMRQSFWAENELSRKFSRITIENVIK